MGTYQCRILSCFDFIRTKGYGLFIQDISLSQESLLGFQGGPLGPEAGMLFSCKSPPSLVILKETIRKS